MTEIPKPVDKETALTPQSNSELRFAILPWLKISKITSLPPETTEQSPEESHNSAWEDARRKAMENPVLKQRKIFGHRIF